MSLLNLSLPELLAIFSAISAAVVTLYLLDRSRRRQVVATLRFWRTAQTSEALKQKRRIQQPWSLLLQMIGIGLLLLAIAQMQWGDSSAATRDHVLVLDTSAWMGARTNRGTLMDEARSGALGYLRSLPPLDRLMIVRAGALSTPATPFDANRAMLERAIRESSPESGALNLDRALEYAARVQSLHSRHPGEIVYVGPGRVESSEQQSASPANLRVIPVVAPSQNCGLRQIGLRRAAAGVWQVFVVTRNYGSAARTVQLAVQFGGAPVGNRTLALGAGEQQESSFTFRTRAAGWLEARILSNDPFPEDDRAVLEVPSQASLDVVVYSDQPELLRAVLGASQNVHADYRPTAAYNPNVKAGVVVMDRFSGASPTAPAIWINPPPERSPVRVRGVVNKAKLASWTGSHDLGTGLRTRDVELETTSVFTPAEGDIAVASVDSGPVILARPRSAKGPQQVVFGFHPALSAMKYELATPLLFANILRWISPPVFQQWELNAGTVGSVEAKLAPNVDPKTVTVTAGGGQVVPFTVQGDHVRFFAGTPGTYRLQAGDREVVYSLTLPDLGENQWTIPASAARGIPRSMRSGGRVIDLWPWLTLAGTLVLIAEWMMYGRGRRELWAWRRMVPNRQRVLQRKAS